MGTPPAPPPDAGCDESPYAHIRYIGKLAAFEGTLAALYDMYGRLFPHRAAFWRQFA
jgi:hypothetical protein